jgi:hypothetical protein
MLNLTEVGIRAVGLPVHPPIFGSEPLDASLPKPRDCPACGAPAKVVHDAVVVVTCSNLLCRSSPKTELWQRGYLREAIEQWNSLRGIKKWAVQGPRRKPPLG